VSGRSPCAALLALGFRPFFLLAGLAAMLLMPLWLAVRFGLLALASPLGPVAWHGHEMLFGYAVAVIAGFLLTAVANWTGRPTLRGLPLGLLALLWLAGRIAPLGGGLLPSWPAAAVDLAFLPALAAAIAVPLVQARNRRNMAFPVALLALAGLNLGIYLAAAGAIAPSAHRLLWVTVDVVVAIMVIVGGRVIPPFTRNALPAAPVRPRRWSDWPSILLAVLIVPLDLIADGGAAVAALSLAAGLANAARLSGWGGTATARSPILWVLHLGYLWIVAGLVLRGIAEPLGPLPADAALHALTAGAVGTLTLGMMTRVALGHTGRPLVAPPTVAVAYGLVQLAALARLAAAFAIGGAYDLLLVLSAAAWTAAFALFVFVYAPILLAPRADRRAG
jgi:uncharacterized protein involved in response to NO